METKGPAAVEDSLVRQEVTRWLTLSGLAVLAWIFAWSAKIVFLGDEYIDKRFDAAVEYAEQTTELNKRFVARMDNDIAFLDTVGLMLAKQAQELGSSERFFAVTGQMLSGIEGRATRAGNVGGYVSRMSQANVRKRVSLRLVDSLLNRAAADSILVSSLVSSPTAQGIVTSQLLIDRDLERWRAIRAWVSTSGKAQGDPEAWNRIGESERRFGQALYAFILATVSTKTDGSTALDDPAVKRVWRLESPEAEFGEIARRIDHTAQELAELPGLADTRSTLAQLSFLGSVLAFAALIHLARKGRLPHIASLLRAIGKTGKKKPPTTH